MRLYSIQPLSVWNDLSQGRVVTARPFEQPGDGGAEESWLDAYQWLATQMRSRGVAPLEDHAVPDYPMWAWHWYNGHRNRRPDLRHTTMRQWSKTRRMVLLTLDVDDARVQLSDYDGWHWCLNYWYLGRRRETNAFERELKAALNTSYYREKPLSSPAHDARLRKSWQRIFDLDAMRPILDSPKKKQIVQATFWHLAKQDVTSAVEFGLGRASRPLDFSTHPHLQESP